MAYNIEALKKMIETYNSNIEMFSKYDSPYAWEKLAEMVASRRLVAAMIENGGEAVVPSTWRNGNVFFDSMLYSASVPGADTSWWTKGT